MSGWLTGRCPDGIVEAAELPDASWCIGVQWHPELLPDDAREQGLFTAFTGACASYALEASIA